MRPFALLSALLLAPGALAVSVEKSILVTYKEGAPSLSSLIDQAHEAILKAGGRIEHEFKFIRGFHATVTEDVVDQIKEWGKEFVTVEEDKPVSIANGKRP